MLIRTSVVIAVLVQLSGCASSAQSGWTMPPGAATQLIVEFEARNIAVEYFTIRCDAPTGSGNALSSHVILEGIIPKGSKSVALKALVTGEEIGRSNGWRAFEFPYVDPSRRIEETFYLKIKGRRVAAFADGQCQAPK